MQNTDIQVREYAGGEELPAACKEAGIRADVIFLDVRMPGTDGMETARLLRQQGERCLIVFLTSLSEYAAKGYEVRAFRYLLKEEADREEYSFYGKLDAVEAQLTGRSFLRCHKSFLVQECVGPFGGV